MKYFLSAGIYHIDAVVIVLGCRPYLDVCDSEKTLFYFFFCGGPHSKALWTDIKTQFTVWVSAFTVKTLGEAEKDKIESFFFK